MTDFYKFLTENGFNDLNAQTTQDLEALLSKLYQYVDAKYGKVPADFFTKSWSPNTAIKRGAKEGLDVHHAWEYDPDNMEVCSLSDPETAKMWFDKGYVKYQLAEYLHYCNWIEHQAIHAVIDTLRTRQFGAYRPGCIDRRAPILNRYFNEGDGYVQELLLKENFTAKNYFKVALETVEDEFDAYELIMDEWAAANGIEDWLIFGNTLASLENCFDIYLEE